MYRCRWHHDCISDMIKPLFSFALSYIICLSYFSWLSSGVGYFSDAIIGWHISLAAVIAKFHIVFDNVSCHTSRFWNRARYCQKGRELRGTNKTRYSRWFQVLQNCSTSTSCQFVWLNHRKSSKWFCIDVTRDNNVFTIL